MSKLLHFIHYKDLVNWSVAHLLDNQFNYNKKYKLVKIGDFLKRNKTIVIVKDEVEYKRVTIKLNNGGVFLRDKKIGSEIGTKKQYLIKEGQFLISKIDARNGAFGIATKEVDGAIITADFFAYDVDKSKIEPYFLVLLTTTKQFKKFSQSASSGTTGRQRIKEKEFLNIKIPLPALKKQKEIVKNYQKKIFLAKQQEEEIKKLEKDIEEYLYSELGIEMIDDKEDIGILQFVNFSQMDTWGVERNLKNKPIFKSKKYQLYKLEKFVNLVRGVTYKKENETIKENATYKVLRANNINLDNSLNFNEIKYISNKEKFSDEKKLKKDDIFICLASGSKKHIGKTAYIESDLDYYFGGFMGALRIFNKSLDSKFLYTFLSSKLFNIYLSNKIFASNINNLSAEILYSFQIPLPPLYLQKNIANHILKLKEQISTLKQQAKENKALAFKEFEKEIFEDE